MSASTHADTRTFSVGPRGRRMAAALVLAVIALGVGSAGADARLSPARSALTGHDRVTWASAVEAWRVWTRPSAHARAITRLRLFTEDGFPEVYELTDRTVDAHGREWIKLRYPRRPNGTVGWVERDALGQFHANHRLLTIDRRTLRATLADDGRIVWRAPVGVGKASTPTPGGDFWVREKFPVHPAGTLYGNYALGTAAYSRLTDWPGGGVVGVHGTNEPWLVPGRPSHGCIRVHNADMARLYRLITVGTPIRIR